MTKERRARTCKIADKSGLDEMAGTGKEINTKKSWEKEQRRTGARTHLSNATGYTFEGLITFEKSAAWDPF